MPNVYADLKTLKSVGVLNLTGTSFDSRLLSLLEDTSRWIDAHCNRHFYVLQATRKFDGPGGRELQVSDLVQVTSLATDENLDRVFEISWTTSDYMLYPLNAAPQQAWGRPYTRVVVDVSAGTRGSFPKGPAAIEINGKWGYREELQDSGGDINEGATFSSTDALLTVTDGSLFAPGHTLLVETEQMYVSAVAANDLTVTRGENGTTAASHPDGTDIFLFKYPGPVVEACLLRTSRLWRRRDTESTGRTHFTGNVAGVDADVERLLSPYRRAPLGVGI